MSPIERLTDLEGQYDAILCDAWGVIHNGVAANVPAVAALSAAMKAGTPVVILTNAPRTQGQLIEYFSLMGVDAGSYCSIISSGEVGRDALSTRGVRKCLHLGPKIDEELFRGVDVELVSQPAEANIIFATGLRDNTREKAAAYASLLNELVALKLPMICVNPDKHVHIGNELRDCAGALAEIYEGLGGEVAWIGKPHPEIYQRAEERLSELLKHEAVPARILAIGDAVHTDILGAARRGYQTLFVSGGIHKGDLEEARIDTRDLASLTRFCLSRGARPDFFMSALA